MNAASARGAARLPPEVNRILYVRNLPYKTEEALSTEEIYDIFGKYGAIRQIRLGNAAGTKVRRPPTAPTLATPGAALPLSR